MYNLVGIIELSISQVESQLLIIGIYLAIRYRLGYIIYFTSCFKHVWYSNENRMQSFFLRFVTIIIFNNIYYIETHVIGTVLLEYTRVTHYYTYIICIVLTSGELVCIGTSTWEALVRYLNIIINTVADNNTNCCINCYM